MRDRDDELSSDYDLSAWEVPPPSAGLADAVIARVREPASAAAAVEASEKPTRRWWIAGGIAAVVAAAVAFALWGIQRAPKNGEGDVVAAAAQQLDLGASSAQLDPGTQIHWRRDKHMVAVTQSRGAASWTVAGDDTFVIDAGAMVASVEATGASLRVEVKMNLSDARVIGASAVTAAVVAMVTVIVYEGRVKVTNGGQTVTVAPGATLELRGPIPPTPDRITVGAGPDYAAQLAEKDRQIEELKRKLALSSPSAVALDPTEIDILMGKSVPAVRKCLQGVADTGNIDADVMVAPDGVVSNVALHLPNAFSSQATCISNVITALRFSPTPTGGTFSYSFQLDRSSKTVASGTCDEVSCVLNNYAGACCAKFKPAGKDPHPRQPVTSTPR
ncbi:MAG: hypothetical protein IPQ07_11005 [Myxococcales bacterium]|nr:hypothetical protein [Myxococcales bacterium]